MSPISDNVNITPGSGAVIGADDVSGVLIQRVKATWGADGTYADTSVAAPMPIRPIPTMAVVSFTMAEASITSASTNYAAGDVIGIIKTLSGVASANGRPFRFRHATCIDSYALMGPFKMLLFSASITLAADNAAHSISDADRLNYLGVIRFPAPDADALGRTLSAVGGDLDKVMVAGASTTDVYAVLVADSDNPFFTAAAGDGIVVNVVVEQL